MGKYTFGPVSSRRFGVSLGIDLSPDQKSCNFDCLYCELPKAQRTDTITNPAPVEVIIADVSAALQHHPQAEVITITANGEPTLYPYLEVLIDQLNQVKKGRRLLILSNAAALHRPEVQKALLKIDTVKLSLDCATERCFKRIDRPLAVTVDTIIHSIIEFRQKFRGELVIEILLVEGINDTMKEFEAFAEVLPQIGADRIDIGTIDRPPAYDVRAVPFEKIAILTETLLGLPFNIVTKRGNTEAKSAYSDEEILNTFAKRPFSKADVERLFDEDSKTRLTALLEAKKVETVDNNGIIFFHTTKQ